MLTTVSTLADNHCDQLTERKGHLLLYLLKPDGSTQWVDFLNKRLIAEHEETLDFNKISWDLAERALDVATLDLAMRYGYKAPQGIAVDAGDLVPLDHLRRLLDINPDNNRLQDLPGRELMEALFGPGVKEHDRELDARVKESHDRAIAEARKELEEALEAPHQTELVDHWNALGGGHWLR